MTAALEPRAVLIEISKWGWAAVGLVSLGGVLWGGLPWGIGLFSGGGVTLLSLWWLGSTCAGLPRTGGTWVRFIGSTLIRYAVLAVVLIALVRSSWVSPLALALGLAVPLPPIAWRGIRLASQMAD